jgi:hypothetical protein
MAVNKCVLVYGRCLNLAGVAACLKLDAHLNVHLADPHQCGARAVLEAFNPETIIYDLTDPPPDLDLALLGHRPGTQLIGVDPSSDDVLVLTGKRSRAVTMGELAALVAGYGRGENGAVNGGGGTFEQNSFRN